jgi:dTDP-4-dehydrorhamnose reductase
MHKKRLLVVGARGFLGLYAVQAATEEFQVIQASRTIPVGGEDIEINIADASSVDRAFLRARPDAVLLLAARSDIDQCEASPEEAFAINAHGAENVANACARANARLLFTSSAAVFDGKKHGYHEEDAISPVSVYGKTKAWAESAVQAVLPSAIVVRFALVLGFARKAGTNSMLDGLMHRWKAGEAASFPTREERNPIDAGSLAKLMIAMLSDRCIRGIVHVGASDCVSRFELGKRLAARAGVSSDLVLPQNEPVPGRAPRGADHFLLTDKLRDLCNFTAPTTDLVIERCFS